MDEVPDSLPLSFRTEAEHFMQEALREAEAAGGEGELPIGAVIVYDGQIVARARSAQRRLRTQLAHAELLALQQLVGDPWQEATDAVVVTNVEPCPLCLGAVVMTDIAHVVFAQWDDRAGAHEMLQIPYVRRHIATYHGGLCDGESASVTNRYGLQLAPP
jgi:tRNA(Arg) A34 adenosine deaminase TadA